MPLVTPRCRSALLWGLVGALSFLVAHGAYLLLGGAFLGVAPIAAVTLVVFFGAATSSDYVERRLSVAEQPADAGE
ncbi:MAG: hypothetical protein ACI9TI_001231 [Natronomonas sp.]|jgi:hypothetical protein|uniref:hypothetical protein n=1 Tax=Natronomonas sp. TaxID=2184060 RepID=UPI0039891327